MGLLAETRSRRKLDHDPNNTKWTRDSNKFGQKILQSQGWQPGEFLGAKDAPHAAHHSKASASFIRVSLKDDMKGLGFDRRKDDEISGLNEFNDLLSRLNGKSDAAVTKEKQARLEVQMNAYVQSRYGPMRFVRGGLLVGDELREENAASSSSSSSAEETADEKEEVVKAPKKRKAADAEDDETDRKKRRKEERKSKKRSTDEDEEDSGTDRAKDKKKKSKKSKKDKSGDDGDVASSGEKTSKSSKSKSKSKKKQKGVESREASEDDEDSAKTKKDRKKKKDGDDEEKRDKKERKRERKEKKLKEKKRDATTTTTTTTTSTAAETEASSTDVTPGQSGASTPRMNPHRVRSRFLAAKREAMTNDKALDKIWMVKA